MCVAIAPSWFSTEHLWTALMPFWLSTDDMGVAFTIAQHVCMKFKCKNWISIFFNTRYSRLKLLKNNNKKTWYFSCFFFLSFFLHCNHCSIACKCNFIDSIKHTTTKKNFKNIPCYVTSEVSLRFYFALFDGLTSKTLKLAYISFCIQTLCM